MAEHYAGINLVVYFGSVDISAYARTCTINESADAPDSIDTTHKGDTAKTDLEGLPGAIVTDVSIGGVQDIYDSMHAFSTMALNTKDTLIIYTSGKETTDHLEPMLTLNNARLNSRDEEIPYDGSVELSASWHSKNSLIRGTYDSSA